MQGLKHGAPDEATLIRRLKKGDFAAFDAIFQKHRRGLMAYVRTIVVNNAMAEDIVQECFVKFVQKIDSIRPSAGASGWLYRVARNASIDAVRRGRFEVLTDMPQDYVVPGREEQGEVVPGDKLALDEEHAATRSAVDELPQELRSVIVLRYFSELKFREIATALDRPLGTVLWQGRRGLEELRAIMKRQSQNAGVSE